MPAIYASSGATSTIQADLGGGSWSSIPRAPGNTDYDRFVIWEANGGQTMNAEVNEGSSIFLRGSVNIPAFGGGVSQQIASGTTGYWRATGTGVSSPDFDAGSPSGSFQIQNNGTFNQSIGIRADESDEDSEYVYIYLYSDSSFTTDWGLGHARFTISDTSLNPYSPQVVYGTTGNDELNGRQANDRLYGYAGDDLASGLGGDDRAYGGYGNDRIYGNDGDDELYGEQDDDFLYGGNGNDRLTGGEGIDYLDGGNGSDTYVLDDERDTINDSGNSGEADTIILRFSLSTYSLANGIENLNSDGSVSTIIGNTLDNIIHGGASSSAINGGEGRDVLLGQLGADRLSGGSDADTFQYERLDDSSAGNKDIITDFQPGKGDKIDLSEIDANALIEGDQAFRYSSGKKFTKKGSAGQLIFNKGIARVDVDGDRQADMEILISGIKKANASFFDL